jgi:hypothetical protein
MRSLNLINLLKQHIAIIVNYEATKWTVDYSVSTILEK